MRSFFFLLLFFPHLLLSQSTGVLFTDFSSNVKGFEDDSYRKRLESLIAELDYSVTCVNRDSVAPILKLIQKEENLRRDFNAPQIKNVLSSANVDFVGYGNFKKFFGGRIDFQLEFVKTSGTNVLSSKTFVKTFKEDDLIETSNFTDSMRAIIKGIVFTPEHGLIEKGFVEEVSKELKIKNQEISTLNSKLNSSNKRIGELQVNIKQLEKDLNSDKYRELDSFRKEAMKNLIKLKKEELSKVEFKFTYESSIHPDFRKFIYQINSRFAEKIV